MTSESREERVKLIKKIEELRKSRIITYFTVDRKILPGLPRLPISGQISDEAIPIFYKVLSELGEVEKIDLFLYSRGGQTEVPWKIVSLVREYCDEFNVLIPFRAHSAATMIVLGADEIVCCPGAELGPIDPSLTTPFNPKDNLGNPLPISIEAVRAYLEIFEEGSQENIERILELLIEKTHPLALGDVFRQHQYIRSIAYKLLQTQKNPPPDELSKDIIDALIEKMYYHGHAITRQEAKKIGLNIVEPDPPLNELILELYDNYFTELKLDKSFTLWDENTNQFMVNNLVELPTVFIETSDSCYMNKATIKTSLVQNNIKIELVDISWVKI
jgi:hypothetical protein